MTVLHAQLNSVLSTCIEFFLKINFEEKFGNVGQQPLCSLTVTKSNLEANKKNKNAFRYCFYSILEQFFCCLLIHASVIGEKCVNSIKIIDNSSK